MCSVISSGVDNPAYVTFVLFCYFCVSKNRSTGLLCSFVTFVFQKKPLYGLLSSFVTFVFQKTALRSFCDVFRDIFGLGQPDVRYFCALLLLLCFKKPLYGVSVMCSAISSGLDNPTVRYFCALLLLLCFKKKFALKIHDQQTNCLRLR